MVKVKEISDRRRLITWNRKSEIAVVDRNVTVDRVVHEQCRPGEADLSAVESSGKVKWSCLRSDVDIVRLKTSLIRYRWFSLNDVTCRVSLVQ